MAKVTSKNVEKENNKFGRGGTKSNDPASVKRSFTTNKADKCLGICRWTLVLPNGLGSEEKHGHFVERQSMLRQKLSSIRLD